MENCYIHLVNNSIGKNSDNFGKTVSHNPSPSSLNTMHSSHCGCIAQVVSEDGRPIEGYMWSFEDFRQHIQFLSGDDLVTKKIQPRLKVRTKYHAVDWIPSMIDCLLISWLISYG